MTDRNRYGNNNLPDFFQSSGNTPLISSNLLSSLESSSDILNDNNNDLTFGSSSSNFDIPLTGLPDFFNTGNNPNNATKASAPSSTRQVVVTHAEVDELAAITGDTGDVDAWSERAAEYAALQANLVKDLQQQKLKEANDYGRDYWSSLNQKEDSQLTSILNLGLDDDDDDVDIGTPVPPPSQPRSIPPTTMTKPASTSTTVLPVSTETVPTGSLSAADLEARLLSMNTPSASQANVPLPPSSSSSVATVPPPTPSQGPVPRLVSLTTMQPVPIPADWNPSLPPPPGTLVIYDQPKPTVPPQQPPQQSSVRTNAPVPPVPNANHPYPSPMNSMPPNAMLPMNLPNNGGPLAPNMLMMLQTQLQHAQTLVQNTPGGMNALPPQMRMQISWIQQMLQSNQIMVQRMQMMQAQQQQQQQQAQLAQQQSQQKQPVPQPSATATVPSSVPAQPTAPTTVVSSPASTSTGKTATSSIVKPGVSYSKILAPERTTVPSTNAPPSSVRSKPVDDDPIVSIGPIVKNEAAAQPERIMNRPPPSSSSSNPPLPPGMAPPLPSGPPPPKPVTLMNVLSGPVPSKLFGTRMSKPEVLAVTRLMFNQLATADPFSEAYYHFALATKASAARAQEAKRLQALAMGIQVNNTPATNQGNVFDAVAVLTSMGTSAIAGGRGKATTDTTDSTAATSSVPNPPRTTSETQNATVDLLAALPTQSMYARNMAANLDDLKKLHAIKRRLWETHNHVLGRQESASIRAPKRTLNLSESGITTGNDLREHKVETNVISSNQNGTDENATVSVPTWTARARIDSAHDSILSLQDAARTLQGYLRLTPPPPSNIIDQARSNVALHRLSLASALGLKAGAPVPPSIDPNDDPEVQTATVKAAQAAMVAAENIHGINAIDDSVILSILSLPKGKRLFARAGPMLSINDRTTLVIAGMRHLPYFVASTGGGKDAETADSTLSSTLATWIRTWMNNTSNNNNLPMLNSWITELQQKHNGSVIRALLQHPGASDVISALLTRGETEANNYGTVTDTLPEDVKTSIATWRGITDALGRAFVESG